MVYIIFLRQPDNVWISWFNIITNLQTIPPKDLQIRDLGPILRICQINVEGIIDSKCQCVSKILNKHKIDVVLVQVMHLENEDQAHKREQIKGCNIIGITYHHIYAVATYLRPKSY